VLPNSGVDRLKIRSRKPCFTSHSPKSRTAPRQWLSCRSVSATRLGEKDVSGVAAVHDALCDIDASAGNVPVGVDVIRAVRGTIVQSQ